MNLLETAYMNDKMNVVSCIRNEEICSIPLDEQIKLACRFGDGSFISATLGNEMKIIDWKDMMSIAYKENKRCVIKMIQQSGNLTMGEQLELACENGDGQFVDECISSKEYEKHNVD